MENYKEKYEQAMFRMNKWVEGSEITDPKEVAEFVFPELKVSEDERMKKGIIEYLEQSQFGEEHYQIDDDIVRNYIAWLEKQDKKDSLVIRLAFTFDDILALQCCMDTVKKTQKDEELYNQLQSLHDRLHDAYWLEKQGEPKPTDDNVEAKFKVGDTIVEKDDDECGYETIKDIKNGQYIFTDGYCMNIDEQEGWQLVKTPTIIEQKPAWSEEDEKHYQGCLNLMKLSLDTKPYPYYNDYLWLKSLKDRIQHQHKQEWSEEDWKYYHKLEMFLEVNEHYSKTEKSSGYQKDVHETLSWLKSLRPNKYVTWSEEDEVMVEDIIEAIDTQYAVSDYNEMVDWLKSLKERYTWKPSDEQIEALLKLEEMHVLEHEKNQENAHLYMVIKNIREQLQKLRKE